MRVDRVAPWFALTALLAGLSFASFAQEAGIPVPRGTKLDITLNTPLSTEFSQPGDRFTADVNDGPY